MKKTNNKGFMLAETLIVTIFVAGVLIFLFIQFSNLSKSYDESYKYNTVEGLYASEDILRYIQSDSTTMTYISENIDNLKVIDLTNCTNFTNSNYCNKLFELENVDRIIVTKNKVPYSEIGITDENLMSFIKKINKEGTEPYRIIVAFKNSTYATLRLGEEYE